MKIKTKIFLLFALLFQLQVVSAKTCVLAFFDPKSEESKKVDLVFEHYKEADYFKQAQLEDIETCLSQGNYSKVLWVSHGSSLRDGLSEYSTPILVKNDGTRMLLPKRYFTKLSSNLSPNLEGLYLNICGVDFSKKRKETHSSIDILSRNLEDMGKKVIISSKNKIASYLLKENVTSLSIPFMSLLIEEKDKSNFSEWRTISTPLCTNDFIENCNRNSNQVILPINNKRISHF